jgi:WD40 repeat protein/serine/threonine protein kinase
MNEAPVQVEGSLESLVGQVADEFLRRQREGEHPDIDAYVAQYPQAAELLRTVLASMRLLELSQPDRAVPEPAGGEQTGTLGDFRLVGEVGRGGMGIVYEAEQISLGRRVALKVLPFASTLDPKQLQRFKNEAQAAAHLHHTNIVPVHATGCERGVHYYAMQLIEGQTVAALIAELRQEAGREGARPGAPLSQVALRLASGRLAPAAQPSDGEAPPTLAPIEQAPPLVPASGTASGGGLSGERSVRSRAFFRTVANLGVQAALALEHAHQLGVIHRDVKPGNLLVDGHGHLWVTDFGLAQILGDAKLTLTGDLVGTIRYMSPEQALAKRVPVDHRSDIYSLGVTLYELLTLEPAFPGRDRQEVLRQIAFEEPRSLRRFEKAIPAELETIVLKAMAKNPGDRYATAQELADDLKRFVDGEPIRARRVGMAKRALLWTRRRPAVAGLLGVSGVAALAVAGLVLGVLVNARLQTALGEAHQARQREEVQRREAQRFQYSQHITLADHALQDAFMGRLEELLDTCPAEYQHYWEWHYLKRQCHADLLTLRGHTGGILAMAFTKDGRRIATGSIDGTVRLWDAVRGQEIYTIPAHATDITRVAFSPDERWIASAGVDRTVKLWDVKGRQLVRTLQGHTGDVYGLVFSPDGRWIATGSWDRTIKIWDTATGRPTRTLEGHTAEVSNLAVSPDGSRLASISLDETVRLWEVTTGRELLRLEGVKAYVGALAFSPDGSRLVAPGKNRSVKVWDVTTGQPVHTLLGHKGDVAAAVFSPDGQWIASTGEDSVLRIWEAATGRHVRTRIGHANYIFDLAFSPDGTRIASGSQDRTIRFWPGPMVPEVRTLRGHTNEVSGIAFSPDGKRIASASKDQTVKVWDTLTGREQFTLKGHTGEVAAVAFGPDGTWLASAGADRNVILWDLAGHRAARTLAGHGAEVRSVAIRSDGKWIASGDAGGWVRIWEAATGAEVLTRKTHNGEARNLAFSADGSQLASSGADRTVKIWDVSSNEILRTLEGQHCWVHCVAFSPDFTRLATPAPPQGTAEASDRPRLPPRLASGSGDGSAVVWDFTTGERILSIEAHSGYVYGLAFTPDGSRFVTAGSEGTVKLWDGTSGQDVLTLKTSGGVIQAVAFSPDGSQLAAASADGTVTIWDARPWTGELQLELEALNALESLFARPLCKADVIAYLRETPTLRPEARALALALVDRYQEESDAEAYHKASAAVVRQRYLSPLTYRFALRQAETACRLAPERAAYRTTLEQARDRAGRERPRTK